MKKYKNYIISFFILVLFCISVCFVPIDATRFVPQVEKQFEHELGVRIHIEKLIFRFGPILKIKAPIMHVMYEDGQKFGQLDNVKFYVPWSTLFKNEVCLKKIYADKFIVKASSNDKYLQDLLKTLGTKEYSMYPNMFLKNYNILYKDNDKLYSLIGKNFELTKLETYKNLKLCAEGDFAINNKNYINYIISFTPNVEFDENFKFDFDLKNFINQVESLDFHSDILADLKLYKNIENKMQITGLVNIDNMSILDPKSQSPKSFIYLTFLGNKTGVLSNIYAIGDKKIYVQGVVNNSKKPDLDLKVKTDDINIADIYKKIKLFVDCSKYKNIDSVNGLMTADFSVKGNLNKLKSSGYMNIKNASIKSGNISVININSDVDFSNNVISILNATGYVNSAPISLKGKINKELDLHLNMDNVELKHLLPDKYGIKQGVIVLNSSLYGNVDNISHKEVINVKNLKIVKDNYNISFDSLNFDSHKGNTAYISNVIINPKNTENIKLPLLKLIIDEKKLKIPDTNIFMPNSKIQAKAEIFDYDKNNFTFTSTLDGFINSKDLCGITKESAVYPVKININGNKDIQNIEGQIHIINALFIDEPAILNLAAKFDNNVLKIDDLSITPFNGKFSNNFKGNLKGIKKIIISGNIENIKEPVFKNIRIFIPQQINLNIADIIAQVKCDLFINGTLKKPEIVGQLSAQNLIVQYMQLVANNLSIDFNKNIAVLNVPVLKIADTSLGLNAVSNIDFNDGLIFKNANIKSKYFNTDMLLMYKDKLLSQIPITVQSGKFYAERIGATLYNSPISMTAFNSNFMLKNNIVSLDGITSEMYNGNFAGNIQFNLKDENYTANIQGRNVSASPIFDIIAINKDTVSGSMDFDASISGNLSSKSSLNGGIKFIVHNGHMGTLGKLEHLLYAQNVIADSMLRTSLSVVTKAITLKDTGLFKYLRGDITMKNGVANINMLQSQGPLMSLFIKGQYYPVTDYAKLTILGRISDEIVSGLGAFGEFSFNKLMIMLTGEENKLNIKVDDIDKLPQLPQRNTKEFRTIINGIMEKPSSVVQFNWISYTQKSLKQHEVPQTNEKVPSFIESLPY